MNLFIIPSWYPTELNKLSGVFIKDQIQSLAELESDINVSVSLWGHSRGLLNATRPWVWPTRFLWRLCQPSQVVNANGRVHEFLSPKITWSGRLPFGGVRQLIEVNRKNFISAIEKFGSIDLIHAHVSYPAGYVAYLISKEFNVPYLVTEHMGPFPFPELLNDGILVPEIDLALKNAAAVIAVSQSLAKSMQLFGYSEPIVIPNLVDERKFNIKNFESNKIIFLTLCNLSEQKGIDHLLKSIAHWNPSASEFEFRIGGDGGALDKYRALSKSMGLNDRVKWLGAVPRDQVPDLFGDCHIYVMPSRHETFGVVFAEAIASGKPIISTRCGGPEYIVNAANGVLVDVDDVVGLSNAMFKLANSLQLYNATTIRIDFEKRFSRIAVISQLRSLYNQLLLKK